MNAILIPDEQELHNINDYVKQVETLGLTEIGLIPPVGIGEVSIIMVVIGTSIVIIKVVIPKMKKKSS